MQRKIAASLYALFDQSLKQVATELKAKSQPRQQRTIRGHKFVFIQLSHQNTVRKGNLSRIK
jgi:hypothetical protein